MKEHLRGCSVSAMPRKKVSTTLYLTPEQYDALKKISERTRVPVAVYVREGLDLVIEQYSKHLSSSLDIDPDGEPQ